MAESYQPQPVLKVIPKPGGKGMRMLGIPTVIDRLIQQALHQVLSSGQAFVDYSPIETLRYARMCRCAYLESFNRVIRLRRTGRRMRQQLSEFKADFFKALAHPLRISILDALRDGELTVNEISQRFDVEQANASQQLAVLRNRNIVVTRKEGANVYYSVSDKSIFKLLDAAKEIFNHHLVGVRSMLEEIHAVAPTKAARRSASQRVR